MRKVNSARVVTVNDVTVQVKRGPYGNKFTVQHAEIEQDMLQIRALCTADSREPGRIYICNYSMKGDLIACATLN